MNIRFLIPLALLVLGLSSCGPGEQAGSTESGQQDESAAAESPATQAAPETEPDRAPSSGESMKDADTAKPPPPEPKEVMTTTDEESREVWSLIQENHSKLTNQQQRSLQACAELAILDENLTVEEAVKQCRKQLEEKAEEQQQEESQSGEDESGEGGS